MPVTVAEVEELRAAGREVSLDDLENVLTTTAEIIGFLIHNLRSIGADQAEVLHHVEVLVVATEMDRSDIREASDVLVRLGYGRDLGKLLTALARRAKPPPTHCTPPGR